jgi:hypothetical protein
MDRHTFQHQVRPFQFRDKPQRSLSMVSFDDYDLSRLLPKLQGQKSRHVFAYYAFDVCTGALIGAAYSRDKKEDLLLACVRDMFSALEAEGLGCPLEIQTEQHLWSKLSDGLAKEGAVFRFVRKCSAQNSQEKYAESMIGRFKYGSEKRHYGGEVGRHYARRVENMHSNQTRVYDDEVGEYVYEPNKSYTYEQIVADNLEAVGHYNSEKIKWNARDRKWELCKWDDAAGKSRWQVFIENANAEAPKIDKALVARYAGCQVETSIRRNGYCRADNCRYVLENPGFLDKLAPNNYNVTAYWLPEVDGTHEQVYLFQNGKYVGEAVSEHLLRYQVARAEQTEADKERMIRQDKIQGRFDKMVKDGAAELAAVKMIEVNNDVRYAMCEGGNNIGAEVQAPANGVQAPPPSPLPKGEGEWNITQHQNKEELEDVVYVPAESYLEKEAERYSGAEDEEFVRASAVADL